MDTIPLQTLRIVIIVLGSIYILSVAYWMHMFPKQSKAIFMARLHISLWVINLMAMNIVYVLNIDKSIDRETLIVWQYTISLQMLITAIGTLLSKMKLYIKNDYSEIDEVVKTGL